MEVKATSGKEFRWNSDTVYALGLYKILGRALGIWPLNYFDIFSYIRVAFIVISQLWMSSDLTLQLIHKGNCGTPTDLVVVIGFVVCEIVTIVKVIMPKVYEHYLYGIINSAVEDWAETVNEKSRSIMLRYAKIGRTLFITQMIVSYVTYLLAIISGLSFFSIFNDDRTDTNMINRQVPLGPKCWISSDMSTFNYVSLYSIQSIQLFIVCNGYVGSDTFFFAIAMHVYVQFELLHMSIENLDKIKSKVNQRCSIVEISKRHEHLLILAENFEKIYNIIIFVQVGAVIIVICTSGIVLLISLQSPDFATISGHVMRIYLSYIQLFIYCYVGEKLSEQTKKLQVAVYNVSWYNMTPDLVKDMSFIILRCNSPFNLTAGKIYVMNLSNFKNIIKMMGTYFSVIRLTIVD